MPPLHSILNLAVALVALAMALAAVIVSARPADLYSEAGRGPAALSAARQAAPRTATFGRNW